MKYAILERKSGEGLPGIELDNGLRFVVNSISFSNDNEPTLSFDYDLLCAPTFPKEEYEKMIGDWITHVLNCAIEDGNLDKLINE